MLGARAKRCRWMLTLWLVIAAPLLGGQSTPDAVRPTCALLPFENMTEQPGSAYLSAVIFQSVYPGLQQSDAWTLVERAKLKALLTESDLKAAGIATGSPSPIPGADLLVVGEYRDDGGVVTVTARLVRAGSAEVVRQAVWTGHVSGLSDAMPAWVTAGLTGQPPPADELSPEMQRLFNQACHELARGNLDVAIEATSAILETHPRDVPTLLLRAEAELQKKGWDRYAVKDFSTVLNLDADNIAAKLGLARAKLREDQRGVEEGLQWIQEVLAVQPDDGRALLLAAQAHHRAGRIDPAVDYAARSTQELPAYGPAWLMLARLQLAQNNARLAVESATRATQLDSADPAAWMVLGDAQLAAHDREAAAHAFRKAMECNPAPDMKDALRSRLREFN
jgi:cytochrome c-type biogenesis protein CcmH/NrfG